MTGHFVHFIKTELVSNYLHTWTYSKSDRWTANDWNILLLCRNNKKHTVSRKCDIPYLLLYINLLWPFHNFDLHFFFFDFLFCYGCLKVICQLWLSFLQGTQGKQQTLWVICFSTGSQWTSYTIGMIWSCFFGPPNQTCSCILHWLETLNYIFRETS